MLLLSLLSFQAREKNQYENVAENINRNVIQEYTVPLCNGIKVDGIIDDLAWSRVSWTADFIDIQGQNSTNTPRFQTRAKLCYDEDYFYVAAKLHEPHVWTNITKRNDVVFWQNDFEVFINPLGNGLNYYEFEVNALNTTFELTLDRPYNQGGSATLGTDMPGMRSAVHVHGKINDARDIDDYWSVEIAFPFSGFKRYNGTGTMPAKGTRWRINFSRVEWPFKIVNGDYERMPPFNVFEPHYEDNWVWSSQHAINMHDPRYWGIIEFD